LKPADEARQSAHDPDAQIVRAAQQDADT